MKIAFVFLALSVGICYGFYDPICEIEPCFPPECGCPTNESPFGNVKDMPMLVVLSFDDAITPQLYENYYSKLYQNRVNPNGCPIYSTFFLSHESTDYSLVHELVGRGFEIASHSISHSPPVENWMNMDYETYKQEISDVRLTFERFAGIDPSIIVGARSPFLQTSGNVYYQMLADEGFEYDCSRPSRKFLYNDTVEQDFWGLWPYTMDYDYSESQFLDCQIAPCPSGLTIPGFWNVPMVDLVDLGGTECAMLDQCDNRPQNFEDAMALLRKNFEIRYTTNRTPLGLYTHASWFADETLEHNFDALAAFIDEVLALGDVFVVGVNQMLNYWKDPVPLASASLPQYKNFCPDFPVLPTCERTYCQYNDTGLPGAGGQRVMYSCVPCPPQYPWVGNPLGNNL